MTPEQLETLPIGTLLYYVESDEPDDPYLEVYVLGEVVYRKPQVEERLRSRVLLETEGHIEDGERAYAKVSFVPADGYYLDRYHTTKAGAVEAFCKANAEYVEKVHVGSKVAEGKWCVPSTPPRAS